MVNQDHDSFFSSILLKNSDNQMLIAFDQATSSKTMTPTTKSPSSIIEKGSYKDKKCESFQARTSSCSKTLYFVPITR